MGSLFKTVTVDCVQEDPDLILTFDDNDANDVNVMSEVNVVVIETSKECNNVNMYS